RALPPRRSSDLLTVLNNERPATLAMQRARNTEPGTRVQPDEDMSTVSVVGTGMRTHTGVARAMFGALAQRGINISMINTSEVCVSVVVDRERGIEALTCLKEAFLVP